MKEKRGGEERGGKERISGRGERKREETEWRDI